MFESLKSQKTDHELPHLSFNDFDFDKDRSEEYILVQDWQKNKDKKAIEKLVLSHKKLVEKIAYGYRGYGLCPEELIAEGYVGLMQAAERFDIQKGFRFSTYALWWIKSNMKDYIFNMWSLVKVSSTKPHRKLFFQLRRHKNEKGYDRFLSQEQIDEMSDALNVDEKYVREMNDRMLGGDHSLNATVGYDEDSETEWQDWLTDDSSNLEDRLCQNNETKKIQEAVHKALSILSPRERDILIQRRFKEPSDTLDVIAESMGISKERVRQLENRAYDKVHDELKRIVPKELFYK